MIHFSIIIPVYNAAKYLREALDSVKAQTYTDWECVCVDDGSQDVSGAILDEYSQRDSRFVVVHQKNKGEADARNAALQIVKGEWITCLDADDFYSPDRLEQANRLIELYAPDLVRFRVYMGKEDGADFKNRSSSLQYECFEGDEAKKWGWRVLLPIGFACSWFAHRKIVDGLRFRSGMRVKVDGLFCACMANRLNKVISSEYCSYFYRQLPSSAIHAVRYCSDTLRLLDEIGNIYQNEMHNFAAMNPSVYESMKQYLRMHCECDIIDWVRMRERKDRGRREIYLAYTKLKDSGLFDCSSIQQLRYRAPMWWWDKTGQIWGLQLMVAIERLARKLLR